MLMKMDNPSYEGTFYDVEKTYKNELPNDVPFFKDKVFVHEYTIGEQVIDHERSIYTFLDLIGDLGGVQDIIVFFFAFFVSPISEHFFNMKFLRKMYLVRTSNKTIFSTPVGQPLKKNKKKPKFKNLKQQIPDNMETSEIIQEVNLHYPIKLSLWQIIKTYLASIKALHCCFKSQES